MDDFERIKAEIERAGVGATFARAGVELDKMVALFGARGLNLDSGTAIIPEEFLKRPRGKREKAWRPPKSAFANIDTSGLRDERVAEAQRLRQAVDDIYSILLVVGAKVFGTTEEDVLKRARAYRRRLEREASEQSPPKYQS